MFNPVWPVIFDKMAHLCWEYEHIRVVHQHNGVYHVDQELSDIANKKEKENTNGTNKFEVLASPHIISSDTAYNFSMIVIIKNYYPSSAIYPPDTDMETDNPPPKA